MELPVTDRALTVFFSAAKKKFKRRVQMTKVTLALENSTSENCLDQSPQHVSIFTGSVC